MDIAIIGSGHVGQALGGGWLRAGHTVRYGRRAPGSDGLPDGAHGQSYVDAVAASEVVVLATPFGAVADVVPRLGDLAGRPLLDATNPIGPGLANGAPAGRSGAEYVQELVPAARVVKVFNSVGAEVMADTDFGAADGAPMRPVMPWAADDAAAGAIAASLAEDLGFEPLAVGPLRAAELLEAFARLWITLAMRGADGRRFAFARLVR